MPSTDTKPELTAKASMAQPVSQPAVYANGLNQVTVNIYKPECLQSLIQVSSYLNQENHLETCVFLMTLSLKAVLSISCVSYAVFAVSNKMLMQLNCSFM
jgi:hypothetical protein